MKETSIPSTSYIDYLRRHYSLTSETISEYLTLKDNKLYCEGLDLLEITSRWGSPLEVGFTPLVRKQVEKMQGYFEKAISKSSYSGEFVYAYASKAAQYEDLIRTALKAGAHYETSTAMDLQMARLHWKAGNLSNDKMIIVNGFKTAAYVREVLALKREGFSRIVPVIESPQEVAPFAASGVPLEVGIRLKVDKSIAKWKDFSKVSCRFGVALDELEAVCGEIAESGNLTLTMFHAMIDTQCVDRKAWLDSLLMCGRVYCELKQKFPTLRSFNFGGGMPVPYSLNFSYDYQAFADELVEGLSALCAEYGVEHPDIIGEFGRYTAAAYGFDFYTVDVAKSSHREDTAWYVINGSWIASLPDTWALNQSFIILPLNGYDLPATKAWISGMTCDSDDVYRATEDEGTLVLPDARYMPEGEKLILGVFMTGAYQDMLSGIGGVHHCLVPEPGELVIEEDQTTKEYICTRAVPPQSVEQMASILGYERYLGLLQREEVNAEPPVQLHAAA